MKKKTDAQIIAQLKRSRNPKTAEDLGGKDVGVTAARLRTMADQGVVEAGRKQTGRAGRPAVLFTLTDAELEKSGATNEQAGSAESTEATGVPAREG